MRVEGPMGLGSAPWPYVCGPDDDRRMISIPLDKGAHILNIFSRVGEEPILIHHDDPNAIIYLE